MPAIQVMIKPASGLCNMRCSYCFYADEMANRKQASYGIMSEQMLENVIMRILETAEDYCSIAWSSIEIFLKWKEIKKRMQIEKGGRWVYNKYE
ncbi:MAG: hypothetical protein K2P66_07840 [Lachnospiraceae bacterium]|nr:hypothetical protein [Lachnospiraceae bacterium]